MALMSSILLNKRSNFHILVLLYFLYWDCLFSAEATLGVYYRPIREVFTNHNTASLFKIKDNIQENFRLPSQVRELEVSQFAQKAILNADERVFLSESLKANRKSGSNHNHLKELVGFIFYSAAIKMPALKTIESWLKFVLSDSFNS